MARTEKRGIYRVLVRELEGKVPLRRLGVDGMIILKLASEERLNSVEGVSGLSHIKTNAWDDLCVCVCVCVCVCARARALSSTFKILVGK